MPRNSRDSMLRQWSMLLKAVYKAEADLGGVAPFREALENAYAEALSNRAVRESMRASAKESTRRLTESFDGGCDAAISLRNFIKGMLGPRSEKLRQFGIKPRHRRAPSKTRATIGFGPPA